ncbi:MAG: Helix-turn-helix domain protein [Firmicutes bacterium ADurb.Bin419]|nr:MAG: Helix-turn-helix domain protein [Firmicutes bacterium ADurb.Bin419]
MKFAPTKREIEEAIGESLKNLRLRKNMRQLDIADDEGISLTAIKRLESGQGGTLKTLAGILRALNRTEWIDSLAPQVQTQPMTMLLMKKRTRTRASMPKCKTLK